MARTGGMTSARASRAWRRAAPRWGSLAVVLLMALSAVPASAVAPKGALDVPAPPDYGTTAALKVAQENESRALGDPEVAAAAEAQLSSVVSTVSARTPATGPYELRDPTPPKPPDNPVMQLLPQTPYSNLTTFIDLLFDQPLMTLVMTKSGGHVNYVKVRLSPNPNVTGLGLGIVNAAFSFITDWAYVDIDNDTRTGDAQGRDVRLMIAPFTAGRNLDVKLLPLPPTVTLVVKGGLEVRIERLDPSSSGLPIEAIFMKSFRYNQINYTWFIDYSLDRLPGAVQFSISADHINWTSGNLLDLLLSLGGNGTIRDVALGNLAGPYTISNTMDEPVGRFNASLGYLRILTPSPTEGAVLDAASWLTARVTSSARYPNIPQHLTLWLDSPAFNRSFDHLNWTADIPCNLDLEYVDDRGDNYTQATGSVHEMPASLRVKIDNVTEGDVGSVSKIHFTSSEPVGQVLFDEWEFSTKERDRYLHSHVELKDMPRELWLNGTLDIGGIAFGPVTPDRNVRNFVPQLLDAVMVRISSKLFTIGRTIRSIPQNILNMPDRKGYSSLELPVPGSHLGKLEFWLTSGHYITVDPETDYFAFYNDTLDDVQGKMVKTSFAGRLMDVRGFHASFRADKHIDLESMYSRELRALFVDAQSDANASIYISNVPHNITVDVTDKLVTYTGDTTIDRVQYTSAIKGQYMRLLLTGVPGDLVIDQGTGATGILALTGAFDSVDLQVTDRQVLTMAGDHILISVDADRQAATSLHLTGLTQFRYSRDTNHVTLRSAGLPFSVLMDDESEHFHARAKLDPLPSALDADITDVLGLGRIQVPTLVSVTSVLDFATLIYAVSEVGADILDTVRDVSGTVVTGLGTFTTDFKLNYTAETGLDLVAEARHTGLVDPPAAQWAHGAVVHQMPYGGEVLLDAKIYLTGLPPSASISLRSVADTNTISIDLRGFKPRYPQLTLVLDGASQVSGGAARDLDVFIEGLTSPMDLRLGLTLKADMRVGGTISGDVDFATTHALGAMHIRMRTRQPQVATVEMLLPRVPSSTKVSFDYSGGVSISADLSSPLAFAFLKLSRDLSGGLSPAATVTLHDVPKVATIDVETAKSFDMDARSPIANLPRVTIDGSAPGLDVLADLEGRALGNKADLHLDARDLKAVSMTPSSKEWRLTAEGLEFIHLRIDSLPYSRGLTIDRFDLAAESVRSLALRVDMVFGVYPLFDLRDVRATALQFTLDGTISIGGRVHNAHIMLIEVPLDLRGYPRSHTNGVAIQATSGDHRLIVPAPMGTLLGTVMD